MKTSFTISPLKDCETELIVRGNGIPKIELIFVT